MLHVVNQLRESSVKVWLVQCSTGYLEHATKTKSWLFCRHQSRSCQ